LALNALQRQQFCVAIAQPPAFGWLSSRHSNMLSAVLVCWRLITPCVCVCVPLRAQQQQLVLQDLTGADLRAAIAALTD
jgi:hypothetical protein